MNGWLLGAAILAAALVPLTLTAARRPPSDGVVVLEVAGVLATAILLLLAEGTASQSFADLALVLAAVSFAGTMALLRFLERTR